MFEAAELERKISREDFDRMAPALRNELLQLQFRLRDADFPVIIVFAGVDGAGKNQTANLVNEWLDPRHIATHAYGPRSDEERERPEFWRYWRDLPPKGTIGIFLSSWYHDPLVDRAYGAVSAAGMDEELQRIANFEQTLADDGALILKFWMHLSQKAQKKRLKKLEADPMTAWEVSDADWTHWRMYDQFITAGERLIRHTNKSHAPWIIVEGQDSRYRSATVLTTLRDALSRHLEGRKAARRVAEEMVAEEIPPAADETLPPQPSVLSSLDMSAALARTDYEAQLQEQRRRLALLHRKANDKGISTVLVFEGWDAAGKGGAIRRLTAALNARDVRTVPVAAPTEEERAQHYLWRFWRRLSRAGQVTVFDRSWYGRVLVERVEGFCSEEAWRRAYAEINDFEEQLAERGVVLAKFWLHITPEEQLLRFQRREGIPYKSWKLTDEDWRNRAKWPLYEQAVNDMVEMTSSHTAPWTLVEANDKYHARVKVLRTVCDALEARLKARKK